MEPRTLVSALDNRLRTVLLWYPVFFGLLLVAINWFLDFHQQHNDFWDCYFIARHLSLSDVQTLFNPQYPIGYCSLLRGISGQGCPTMPAIVVNGFFAAIALFFTARVCLRFLNAPAALFAVIALSLYPRFFHYNAVGGADPGSVAFFALGAAIILCRIDRDPGRFSRAWFFAGGLFLGVSALFRYHAFVNDALFLAALGIVFRKRVPQLAVSAVGVALAYSPQWIVNIITGHHLFETQFGPMNVYDLMYTMNWHQTMSTDLPGSVFTLIKQDPLLFVRKYAAAFASFAPAYLPPLVAAFVARDREHRALFTALTLWTFGYFVLFSAFTSGRQILLPLPLAFVSVGFIVQGLWRLRRAGKTAALLAAGVVIAFFCYKDVRKIYMRAHERDTVSAVESSLDSLGCRNVREIFTSDFDLYFRALPFHIPYFNGGAPRWGTYLYNNEYPEFSAETDSALAASCRERGVRFVALTKNGGRISGAVGGLYETESSPYFVLRTRVDRFKLFTVVPGDPHR